LADSANFKGSTLNKLCNGLIGNRFEMPNVSYTNPLQASRKKDNDTMTMKFLLHKDKEERKSTAQKQECGCPSLQSSLRSHTHAFLQPTGDNFNRNHF